MTTPFFKMGNTGSNYNINVDSLTFNNLSSGFLYIGSTGLAGLPSVTTVTPEYIALNSVTAEKLASSSVTSAKLQPNIYLSGAPTVDTPGATGVSNQIANTEYVKTAINNLVNSAPTSLDTLNELATALGNDDSFFNTINNSLATKVSTTGNEIVSGIKSFDVLPQAAANLTVTTNNQLTTKLYVDTQFALYQGDTGSQGRQGVQGEQGIQGFMGAQGGQGIQGFMGAQGAQGAQGAKGATSGRTGLTGAQGFTGAQGKTGAQGTTIGKTGASGATGIRGPQGQTGATGVTGTTGRTGLTGSVSNYTIAETNVTLSSDYTISSLTDGVTRYIPQNVISFKNVGTGINGTVKCFCTIGTNLYIGGQFTSAGGVAVNNICRYDGTAYYAMGNGITGTNSIVNALCANGTDLYIGGVFTLAGTVNANNVCKYSTTNTTYSYLGTASNQGVNNIVNTICFFPNDGLIYIGGSFTTIGSFTNTGAAATGATTYKYLCKTNGTNLTTGMTANSFAAVINVLCAYSVVPTYLFVGFNGEQTSPPSMYLGRIIPSTNTIDFLYTTDTTYHSPSGPVLVLYENGGFLYIGGNFSHVRGEYYSGQYRYFGQIPVRNLTKYSPNYANIFNYYTTSPYKDGFDGIINTIYGLNNTLYVGGNFTNCATQINGNTNPSPTPAKYICKMDISTQIWSQLSSGLNGFCNAITLYNSKLYLGGEFTTDNTSNSINRICYVDNTASIFYNSTVLTVLNENIQTQNFEEIETTTVSGLTGAPSSRKYLSLLCSGKKYIF